MTDLYVDVAGRRDASTALVFMHGGMGLDHTYLRPYVDGLGDEFRLVFFDHRLNGRSPRTATGPQALDGMARDARDVVADTAAGCRVIVVSHSFGAWVAIALAALAPDATSGIVLVAPGLSPSSGQTLLQYVTEHGTPAVQQAVIEAFTGRMQTDEEYRHAWLDLVPLYLATRDAEAGRRLLRDVHFSLEGFYAFLASGIDRFDWKGALGRFRGPVLVVSGDADFMEQDPGGGGAAVASVAPQGTFLRIPGAGHMPFADQPAAFCDAVRRWAHAHVTPESGGASSTAPSPRRSRT